MATAYGIAFMAACDGGELTAERGWLPMIEFDYENNWHVGDDGPVHYDPDNGDTTFSDGGIMSEVKISHGGKIKTYSEFVEKFKPKHTTDDCMTPPKVYDVVADWVANEYGLDKSCFVRPFWPGGDYENFDYPDDCVVVDNPPFSILSKIVSYYVEHGIKYFLFAPALTLFTKCSQKGSVVVGVTIEYENGAKVPTSFVTNLDTYQIRTAPDLYKQLDDVVNSLHQHKVRKLQKHEFDNHIVYPAGLGKLAKYGVEFKIRPDECAYFSGTLDAMKDAIKRGEVKKGTKIFGGAYLVSDAVTQAQAQAQAQVHAQVHAPKHVWKLSERELKIVEQLNKASKV